MEIDSVTITGKQAEIRQAQSKAQDHELQVRSKPLEIPGKYQLTVEKNEPEQNLNHFLFSLGFHTSTKPLQQVREDT